MLLSLRKNDLTSLGFKEVTGLSRSFSTPFPTLGPSGPRTLLGRLKGRKPQGKPSNIWRLCVPHKNKALAGGSLEILNLA